MTGKDNVVIHCGNRTYTLAELAPQHDRLRAYAEGYLVSILNSFLTARSRFFEQCSDENADSDFVANKHWDEALDLATYVIPFADKMIEKVAAQIVPTVLAQLELETQAVGTEGDRTKS